MKPASEPLQHPDYLLLFDGVCHLCNSAVQFILKRDPSGSIHFASLQSEKAQQILSRYSYAESGLSSVVLIAHGRLYTKSDAILRVARKLSGAWPLCYYLGRLFPRLVRDFTYDWVAKNRYRWFGKQEQCMLPTPEIKARFLD
ncbi:thiol-disulfide oxidoreductase DCC family protein [Brevibacillus agri]|uniref:thiol-disulfide oxidoreductase DCC family protein n=1 Tax=Brevibacillus agri TaxID=51101 RepID=UPI002E2285FD|nr:thiol-disulfide oxidoreductase DCC family protein [Brevibacillus agri]